MEFSRSFWKEEGTLFAFEKFDDISIVFWIGSNAYKHTFQKWGEVLSHFLKTQMKFKSLSTLHKNFKCELLKGQLKKFD